MCSESQKMFSLRRKNEENPKVRREAAGEGRQNVNTNGLAQLCVPPRSWRSCVGGKAGFNCIIPAQSAFVTPGIAHG